MPQHPVAVVVATKAYQSIATMKVLVLSQAILVLQSSHVPISCVRLVS